MKGLQPLKNLKQYLQMSQLINQRQSKINQQQKQLHLENINSQLTVFLLQLQQIKKQFQILISNPETQNTLNQQISNLENKIQRNYAILQKSTNFNEQKIKKATQLLEINKQINHHKFQKYRQFINLLHSTQQQKTYNSQIKYFQSLEQNYQNKLQTICQNINKRQLFPFLDEKIDQFILKIQKNHAELSEYIQSQQAQLLKYYDLTDLNVILLNQITEKQRDIDILRRQICVLRDKNYSIQVQIMNKEQVEQKLQQSKKQHQLNIEQFQQLSQSNNYLQNNMEMEIQKNVSQAINEINEGSKKRVNNYLKACSYLLDKFGKSFFDENKMYSFLEMVNTIQSDINNKAEERP